MAFEDAIWAYALNRSRAPYNPNNTLFSKLEERQKEARKSAEEDRRADKQFQNALKLEEIRHKNALESQKTAQQNAMALADKARDDRDVEEESRRLTILNEQRSALYATADAAAKHIGGSGWKPDPNKEPDENQSAAQLVIAQANALAHRAHRAVIQKEQDRLQKLQQEEIKAQTPTDDEVGKLAASDSFLPASVKGDQKRMDALRDGDFDKAFKGLSADDATAAYGTIEPAREKLTITKQKVSKPRIEAITREILASKSRLSAAETDSKVLAEGISTGKPVFMMVPSEQIRPLSGARKGAAADEAFALDTPELVESGGIAIPQAMPGRPATEEREGVSADPEMRNVALQAGMAALGMGQPQSQPASDIGNAFVRGLEAQAADTSIMDALGLSGTGGSFMGIPIRNDPSTVTDLTPALMNALSAGRGMVMNAPDAIRSGLESVAAPVRNAGNAIGQFLNPALRPPQPTIPVTGDVALPASGSFIPLIQQQPRRQATPQDIIREFMNQQRLRDAGMSPTNQFGVPALIPMR